MLVWFIINVSTLSVILMTFNNFISQPLLIHSFIHSFIHQKIDLAFRWRNVKMTARTPDNNI